MVSRPTITGKPFALIVDDEEMFCLALQAFLAEIGIESEFYTDPLEFLSNLKNSDARICFVDINISEIDVGYKVVQAIRSILGHKLPIIVVSARSDAASITNSMEIGASDYLVKPFDQEILQSKILPYFQKNEIGEDSLAIKQTPEDKRDISISFDYHLQSVDEFGFTLRGSHLLGKGAPIWLNSPLVQEITGKKRPTIMKVLHSTLESESNEFLSFIEFDATDDELLTNVRRWISEKNSDL